MVGNLLVDRGGSTDICRGPIYPQAGNLGIFECSDTEHDLFFNAASARQHLGSWVSVRGDLRGNHGDLLLGKDGFLYPNSKNHFKSLGSTIATGRTVAQHRKTEGNPGSIQSGKGESK